MRTKVLLGAALLAASLASSMADTSNVYSLNVVGYVNQPVTVNKWYLWGNPLSAGNNTTASVLTNLTSVGGLANDWAGSVVYAYTAANPFNYADQYYTDYGWYPGNPDGVTFMDLTPGKGFFFQPATSGTVTYVGQVNTTNTFSIAGPGTWTMVSSAFPVSTNLTGMGLLGNVNDLVYRYDTVNGGYDQGTQDYADYGWYGSDYFGTAYPGDADPVLKVGEAVFYNNQNATVNWTQVFTIQ